MLDKLFFFLQTSLDDKSLGFPLYLMKLLFDILQLFGEKNKLLKPVRKDLPQYPQMKSLLTRYIFDHFNFTKVHVPLIVLLENVKKYLWD
jgi:hypothetical protein